MLLSEIGRPGSFIIHTCSQKYQFRQVSEYLVLQTVWQGTSVDTLSLQLPLHLPVLFHVYKDSRFNRTRYCFPHHHYNHTTCSFVVFVTRYP
jgi:hypothetical protein